VGSATLTGLDIGVLSIGLALDLVLAALPLVVWLWHGRDPHFTDDDSMLMPSPPPDFTPALASVVMQGNASRRTIAAGLMDLASHQLIAFRAEPTPVGHRAGLALTTHRPRHLSLPAPEAELYAAIVKFMAGSDYIAAIFIGGLSPAFGAFTRSLDKLAVERGWLHAAPGSLIRKWRILSGAEVLCGVVAVGWIASFLSGQDGAAAVIVAAVGLGACVAGALTYLVSGVMPARTPDGARLAGMLNAYRRTMKATIAQAKTLDEVVVMAPLPWVGDPTSEIAWAVVFGLDRQIDSLLSQSLAVSEAGGWPTGIRDWFSII